MKSSLLLMVGSTLLAAACGSSSGTTSGTTGGTPSGTSAGAASSGGRSASTTGTTSAGATTGGATTGSGTGIATATTGGAGSTTGIATTTGGATGGLGAGAACTSNDACSSDICGINGSGNCCTAACSTSDATCGATACDTTGACTYPTTACGGATSCNAGILSAPGTCDGTGTCGASTPQPCAGNFACADAATCGTTCAGSAECQNGFSCNAGACVAPAATGSCSENDDCTSGICGLSGSGNCCSAACSTSDATCGATGCDPTGACVYPVTTPCGTDSCTASSVTTNACDATGTCSPTTAACPNGYNCDATNTDCLLTCAADTDCATGFYCAVATGTCTAQQGIGPCSANDMCTSGACGVNVTGTNCCTATCSTSDATCGATDCDPTGACVYPGNTALCGATAESCTGNTQQNPSACDGTGNCNNAPGTTDCTPFICGATACLATCTDNTSCGSGDFCDVGNTACCAPINVGGTPGTIAVDSVNGSDANACCGYGSAKPCATITQAMKIIDASQASNVTITATVSGAGGDWAPTGEVYPITLGWGVELSAPGVYFTDVNGNAEIFDIKNYSLSDTLGYASVTGTAASNVWIGLDSTGNLNQDTSAIQVEAGNTLFIANATLNGNSIPTNGSGTTAITVTAGATLTVGQDQLAVNTGTVTIGVPTTSDGFNGIVCGTGNGLGCTVNDATLTGTSSLVIQDQAGVDIDAEDFAVISLTSAPMIGVAPTAVGFEECPSKDDAASSSLAIPTAVLLNGAVTMTFDNGTVSCITGDGFVLQATANGSPTLTIGTSNGGTSTIENTDLGIYAKGGTATVTNTFIQYNFNGVEEDSDTVLSTTGTIDLSGGGDTVACSSNIESSFGSTNPGVSVLNTTDFVLNASNTEWDTATPDTFQCDNTLANCTCEVLACTVAVGADGMDAVYESTTTGTITTTGNTLSTLNCAPPPPPPGCSVENQTGCPVGDKCCGLLSNPPTPGTCVPPGGICVGG